MTTGKPKAIVRSGVSEFFADFEFARETAKGWHEARLLDPAGEPVLVENHGALSRASCRDLASGHHVLNYNSLSSRFKAPHLKSTVS